MSPIYAIAAPAGTNSVLSLHDALPSFGTYQLTLAKTPGSFTVPSGDQGGAMTNGANHQGTIHLGSLDQSTVMAALGDSIALSMGEVSDTKGGFVPWIWLRAPNGAEIGR